MTTDGLSRPPILPTKHSISDFSVLPGASADVRPSDDVIAFAKDAAPWSIWNDQHWGFSHITVSNATHLKMDFYRDAPLGTANDIYHSFEINRAFPRV